MVPRRILPLRKPGRPPRGESGAQQTREHLLHVAREIVAEKGLAELSLREIADRARVNPALLNYYFGGLDALQGEMVDSALDQLDKALDGVDDPGPQELAHGLGEVLYGKPDIARLLLSPLFLGKGASARAKKTRAHLRDAFEKGLGRKDTDADALLVVALSVLCAPHFVGAKGKDREAFEALAVKALRGLADGG